jgi:uncharacterized membrane protein
VHPVARETLQKRLALQIITIAVVTTAVLHQLLAFNADEAVQWLATALVVSKLQLICAILQQKLTVSATAVAYESLQQRRSSGAFTTA